MHVCMCMHVLLCVCLYSIYRENFLKIVDWQIKLICKINASINLLKNNKYKVKQNSVLGAALKILDL